jgi:hypothetical protein
MYGCCVDFSNSIDNLIMFRGEGVWKCMSESNSDMEKAWCSGAVQIDKDLTDVWCAGYFQKRRMSFLILVF